MAEILSQLSNDLANVVESASNSIVRVEARRRQPASGVVWSSDGLIATAHHVVEHDDNIKIGLADGREVAATLVGRDPSTDLALLRADASDLNQPNLAQSDSFKVGHLVLAIGRPGKSPRATLGIVSALGDKWRSPAGGEIDRYLQTDVVMYPGFSGGPLVDADGSVVGINTSAILRGISLTIPVTTITRIVETLAAHGKIRRGYLGIGGQPVRLPDGLAKASGQETGILIASVESGSPAEKGGLFLGDTIISINTQPTRGLDELLAQLTADNIGASLPIKLLRSGQVQEIPVVIGERS